jgi:hypothetical protein
MVACETPVSPDVRRSPRRHNYLFGLDVIPAPNARADYVPPCLRRALLERVLQHYCIAAGHPSIPGSYEPYAKSGAPTRTGGG